MKQIVSSMGILLLIICLLETTACSDSDCECALPTDSALVEPSVFITESDSLYSGYLEVWPCLDTTSIYFGNYTKNNVLTAVNAYYVMNGGVPSESMTYYPVRLPTGTYTMVYWGFPTLLSSESSGQQNPPPLSIGTDLRQGYFQLRPQLGDTLYYPSQELVFAQQVMVVGRDSLAATLQRATSLLNVHVANTDGSALTSIQTMRVTVNGIATLLNGFTAQPSNYAATVGISLEQNTDSTQWSATNVSLFPSTAYPVMTLYVTLQNGQKKQMSQNLQGTLAAGIMTSVQIYLNATLSVEDSTKSFFVKEWVQQTDTIQVPIW